MELNFWPFKKSGAFTVGKTVNASAISGLFGRQQTFSGKWLSDVDTLAVSAVFACVRNMSEDIAKLKPRLYLRDGDGKLNLVQGHPLAKLFRRPNDFQTWFQFVEMCMMSLLMRGNAYVVLKRNGRGEIVKMIPVHPSRITIMEAYDGGLFYRVTSAGPFQTSQIGEAHIAVPQEDMMHLRLMAPDGVVGLSPLNFAKECVGIGLVSEEYQARLLGSGARPGGVLTHPNRLTKEVADRLRENWREMNEGISNAGKTAVLEEGMKWEALGMSSVDAEFMASRRFTVEEIARFFRVPPHIVGDLSRSTNNNIESQSTEYLTNSLMPHLERIESSLARAFDLGPEYEIEFDTWKLLRGDVKSRFAAYTQAKQSGIMTTNELREREGLGKVPGGDVLLEPLNMAAPGGAPASSTLPNGGSGANGT